MSDNYALVEKGEAIQVPKEEEEETPSSSSPRDELASIFESYAIQYPNPRLAEERQERDRLLRALSAADHAVKLNPKRGKKRGIFGFLWRKRASDDGTVQSESFLSGDDNNDEKQQLHYTDIPDEDLDEDYLCGTTVSLDTSCIPQEAHSLARFHLASTQTRGERPNLARTSWEIAGTSCIAVVGLGVIAEFHVSGKTKNNLQHTSDRQDLLDYMQQQKRRQGAEHFRFPYARAATIGPNLLIVSWGLRDGVIVFYRRLVSNPDAEEDWEAVAIMQPTSFVRESLGDVFLEEEETGGSELLRVTDLVPLVVEVEGKPPAAAVAVSRLGGCIELVPLPPQMWYGPEREASPELRKHRRKRRRHPKSADHYGMGKLPDLASNPEGGIIAFATSEYQTDVIGMEAFRTSWAGETQWNQKLYPDSPPAQHVLAAHGAKDGHETITLWSVATLFETEESHSGIGFSVHASLTEALDVGRLGPEVSIIASKTVMRYWRRPRQVELREQSAEVSTDVPRVSTVSVSAPITCLRFAKGSDRIVQAALLDWNGGATILDCELLERTASQKLSEEQYRLLYNNPDQDAVVPMIRTIKDRSHTAHQFSIDGRPPAHFVSLQWFGSAREDFALAALHGAPCNFSLLFPSFDESDSRGVRGSLLSVSCPNGQAGTLHRFGGRSMLYLVSRIVLQSMDSYSLRFCAVQPLHPRDIVQSYARASRFAEALEAANTLSSADQEALSDLLEKCRKSIWETDHHFESLEAIRDDSFVVQQALSSLDPDGAGIMGWDISLLRSVLLLALKRANTRRLGSSVTIGGIEGAHGVADEIRSNLVKLGTYELICRYLSTDPSALQFVQEFLPTSVIDLAVCFARTADMAPLTIICFRHRNETLSDFRILDEIPLAVEPVLYQHLLPVDGGNGTVNLDLFMAGSELLDWYQMQHYLNEQFEISFVVDVDGPLVLEHGSGRTEQDETASTDTEQLSVEDWYVTRASAIQKFVHGLEPLSVFVEIALVGLRIDEAASVATSPAVQRLLRMKRVTDLVKTMSLDQVGDGFDFSASAALSLGDLERMDVRGLVRMIMDFVHGSTDWSALFNRYLLLLMDEDSSERGVGVAAKEINSAIASYCLELITDCQGEPDSNVKTKYLKHAVSVCAGVAASSRTSLEKSSRLIKDKKTLIHLALSVAEKVFEASSHTVINTADRRNIIDALWTMYESLPLDFPPGQQLDEEWADLSRKMDRLFGDLVMVDIVARWPVDDSFQMVRETIDTQERDLGHSNILKSGEKIVSVLCLSFFAQIDELNGSQDNQERTSLLFALISDIEELNTRCFGELLDLRDVFVKYLVRPLLLQHLISLLGYFFEKAKPENVDSESISSEVMSFIDEAVHGSATTGSESATVQAAMECQDVLGRYLPSLRPTFQAVRTYLDAAHFINEVLLPDGSQDVFLPDEIRKQIPLDVVESVLAKYPACIIYGCREWMDPAWATSANETIRRHLHSSIETLSDGVMPSTAADLPPLPGKAIMHLSKLLGLDDRTSVLVIKTRMIQHGLDVGFYGAAAALIRTLIGDSSAPSEFELVVLDAVARLVSQSEFDDLVTKRELCTHSLALCGGEVSKEKSLALDQILQVSNQMELRGRMTASRPHGPVSSVSRFFYDTRMEYSVELIDLFMTLNVQAANCLKDDTLLNALSRYAVFWCISQATRIRLDRISPFESYDSVSILTLTIALVLHIDEKSMLETFLNEVKGIFGEQKGVVIRNLPSSPSTDYIQPDPDIVKRLIGRGYSEFGARRAAIMSQNVGYNEALQWAVTHSLDAGFDDPIIFVKSSKQAYVEKTCIKNLDDAIALLAHIVSGKLAAVEFSHSLGLGSHDQLTVPLGMSSRFQLDGLPPASVPEQSVDGWDESDNFNFDEFEDEEALKNVDHEKSVPNGRPDHGHINKEEECLSLPIVPEPARLAPGASKMPCSQQRKEPVKVTTPNIRSGGGLKVASLGKKLKVPAGRLKVPGPCVSKFPAKQPGAATQKSNTKPVAVPAARLERKPPPPRSSPRTLKAVGKAAFQSARSSSSPSKEEERKRLIEEGRRLLQQVREGSTQQHNYFLRSKAPPKSEAESVPVSAARTESAQEEKATPMEPAETAKSNGWDFDEDDLGV